MQNNKLSDVKNKELVAAGHAFAKAIGMDTPLIEIAKMVAELSGRLDVALVRGDELQKKLDALAAENAAIKALAELYANSADEFHSQITGLCESDCRRQCFEDCNKTPATDAYLNSVRADAITSAIETCTDHCDTDYVMDAYDFSYEIAEMRSAGAIDLHDELVAYANELRSQEAK